MSAAMLTATKDALGNDAAGCASRSLFQDRFAEPLAKEAERKDWFTRLIGKKAESAFPGTDWLPADAEKLHARLMGRLMVNMAGGVMENAGLLLDRYGLPVIPGSAVKACARRMALQALHDWIAAGTERPSSDDACGPCCEGFTKPEEMLAAIARVFGWVDQDWSEKKKDDHWVSDFAWACGEKREAVWSAACVLLAEGFNWKLPATSPWKKLPNFAGTVAFLPARPNADPGLELDVVTPHHSDYYGSTDSKAVATDTEDPIPVFFPAVKPQKDTDYFTFPLLPLRPHAHLNHAKTWLARGLEIFGLGAKTAAGYGWFDASEKLNQAIAERLAKTKADEAAEKAKQEAETLRKAEEEKRRQAKAVTEAVLKSLSPDEQEDWKLAQLNDAQFDARIRAFCKTKHAPGDDEKKAIVRALKGTRLAYWQAFKPKATKGDLAAIEQAIRTLNKQLYADKMP